MAAPSASAEVRLRELGVELGEGPSPLGAYVEAVQTGDLLSPTQKLPAPRRF